MIIEKIETGQYSMREKSGIKCFVIPGRDKPAPLDLDRGRLFRSRLANAERYLKVRRGARARLQDWGISRACVSGRPLICQGCGSVCTPTNTAIIEWVASEAGRVRA